jgi:small subunit ribosomal protein S6
MSLYESVFIARQEISAQQVEALADAYESVIKDNGGSVEKRENWGLRSLAYKIKKNRKGHYVLFNIDAPADALHEMERQMRLNEDVLRYLTLRVGEIEEGPSIPAQVQARAGRDDRPARSYKDTRDSNEKPDETQAKTEETAKVSDEPVEEAEAETEVEAEAEPKAEGEE